MVLMVVSAGAAFGQAQRGSAEVKVTDADEGALPGASVTIASDDTLTRRTVFTDAEGVATLVALAPAANYTVTVSLEGFAESRVEGVVIQSGSETPLAVTLGLSTVSEEVVVTAEAPLVDVTKTQAGQNITLQLTESLPTARSYQDYLELVPGVQDAIGDSGNPASRSGINYSDRGGDVGTSTDNLYYFDGINVTDRTSGTFGANLNTEIIQEQSVLTGAIPAEFVGAPGLISNVVTKSGGNDFSGSINYYHQDDSLVEDNDNREDASFSTYDTAATLGGPIVRDKAWFYGSYRLVNRDDDLVTDDGETRSVTTEDEQGFGKITWSITSSDLISGIFLTDPREQDGSRDTTVANSRNTTREQGGERWNIGYNRVWGAAAFELGATEHEGDINILPIDRTSSNNVAFLVGDAFTDAEAQLGGNGQDSFVTRGQELQRASIEYLFDTSWGDHSLKAGYETGESTLFENQQLLGEPTASWVSISNRYAGQGISLCDVVEGCNSSTFTLVEFGTAADEFAGFRNSLTSAQEATLLGLWDTNGNQVLDNDEIENNMTFTSTAGNPNGQINYTRDLQTTTGDQLESSEFWQAYIQDTWQWDRLSINAGLRFEQWEHFASTGISLIEFDTDVSPRVSLSYDLRGDGRSSVGLFYGRYFDAVRNNMTDFAGSLSGASIDEQVWVDPLGEFVTFRTRGGTTQQDGFFAPTIESPYTDEIQLQYKQDLGSNMMFEINLIDREVSEIMEDFGLFYFDAAIYEADTGPGALNHPDTLFLGPQYLGFNSLNDVPNANFFIATLPGEAFRDWQGLELVFRKRYSDNWQLVGSYNYADAEGNSNSDSNADGAGDVDFLDPRAPGRTGDQPGLVKHLFKVAGSYNWDNGFQVGANYRWNSGVVLNRSGTIAFARHLPDRVDTAFQYAGYDQNWISDDAIGFIDGSEYGVLDLRLSYLLEVGGDMEVDFFLDIFNSLDDQQTVRVNDLVGDEFLEGRAFVDPRRYYLGARLRF
jgi:hypothetical protein